MRERKGANLSVPVLAKKLDLDPTWLLGWLNRLHHPGTQRERPDILRQYSTGQDNPEGVTALLLLQRPLLGSSRFKNHSRIRRVHPHADQGDGWLW